MKGKLLKELTITATATLTALTIMIGAGEKLPAYADGYDAPTLAEYDINGDSKTEEGEKAYKIETASNLYWFAGLVNGKLEGVEQNGFANAYLACDITVNEDLLTELITVNDDGTATKNEGKEIIEWTPIGADGYNGIFDGAGKKISGLYFNDNNFSFLGLFIDNYGTIKNVNVEDSYFCCNSWVGSICGTNYGKIYNCANRGTVTGSGDNVGGVCGLNKGEIICCDNVGNVTGYGADVGGICGHNDFNCIITECKNEGNVFGGSAEEGAGKCDNVGGICGYNEGEVNCSDNAGNVTGYGDDIGGICGLNFSGNTITDCTNTGAVIGSGDNVGGICGYNEGEVNCSDNAGNVTGYGDDIGGICGLNFSGNTITDCTNTGAVIGSGDNVGGVCGLNEGEVIESDNTGDVTSYGDNYVGGICGYNDNNCIIAECKNEGNVIGGYAEEGAGKCDYVGGVCGYNAGEVNCSDNAGNVSGYGEDIGGICGRNISGNTITDCTNTGDVTSYGDNYVGGICGYNDFNCIITECKNEGNVIGGSAEEGAGKCDYVGGVCGLNEGEVKESDNTGAVTSYGDNYVGGICGYNASDCIIAECKNEGNVIGGSAEEGAGKCDCVGGVCGYNEGEVNCSDNAGNVTGYGDDIGGICGLNFSGNTITDCTNTGAVIGSGDNVGGVCGLNEGEVIESDNTGDVTSYGDNYVGGICGYNVIGSIIAECKNEGNVIGGSAEEGAGKCNRVGGVCGYNEGEVNCSDNAGNVTGLGGNVGGLCGENNEGSISSCYNLGAVTASASSVNVDGFCGVNNGVIHNSYCINQNSIEINQDVDCDVTGMDDIQFASGEVCWLLNGGENQFESPAFFQNLSSDRDASPVFDSTHKKVYKNTACDGVSVYYNNENKNQEHNFDENGFCTACDKGYESAESVEDTNDIDGDEDRTEKIYKISNAGQLYWFAGLVNGTLEGVEQNTSANAYLACDIIVNKNLLTDILTVNADGTATIKDEKEVLPWTPIGDGDNCYKGTFDGAGHTISGLYFNDRNFYSVGLVGATGGGTIRNVGVVDSYFLGAADVGGVCGYASGSSIIENCYNTGAVTAIGNFATAGGVCCYAGNSSTIENCYNTGKVTATGEPALVGGVCGYASGSSIIENCYNTGAVTAIGDTVRAGGVCGDISESTIENCYYLAVDSLAGVGEISGGTVAVTGKSVDDFASGEVCWLLNGGENQVENSAFFQNLSSEKDALPLLDNTHSSVYYSNLCKVYSNKQHKIVPKGKVNETCTTTGHAAYWQCEGCGKAFSNEECTIDIKNLEVWLKEDGIIPASGHKLTPTAQVNATCTEEGCKAYWYCSECKTYFADKDCKTKIADLEAWKSKDGKIEKGQHTGGTATCTEKAKCEICGAEYGTVEGHKYAETWNFDAENHWHECEVCHDKKDVAAHTLVTTATNAGIGVEGKIETVCTDCNNIIKTDLIPAIATVKLSQTSYTYNKKAQKPSVIVTDSEGTVIANTNYTVKYSSGRKKVGKYKVTVTFTGNYTGSVELTFTINPPKTSISKVKAGKKSFTVNWSKKTTEVTGYQIQYSTSSKFKTKTKTVTVKSAKEASKTIKKLSGNKKYYVRVRTYKTVGKTKFYSDWSATKNVKTKK